MRLGVHVPIAGGLLEAVARAKRLSCTTMQIFSRSPRGGATSQFSQEEIERFDIERRRAGIEPLAVHGPYIINLASPEAAMWRQSLRLYQEEYARAARLRAQYLVTHVGSHRGQGEAAGMARVSEAINRTLDGAKPPLSASPRLRLAKPNARGQAGVIILLENTAGSGQGLGYQFEQLAFIRNGVEAKERVGICLDTAHLFAAGYPIHTEEGLEQAIASFDRVVGLEHLKLIHLNDSKVPFDSRVDRHWHIGEGHIGLEAFRRMVNHPKLSDLPFVLETPKSTVRSGNRNWRAGEREDRRNLSTVKNLVDARGRSRRTRRVAA